MMVWGFDCTINKYSKPFLLVEEIKNPLFSALDP